MTTTKEGLTIAECKELIGKTIRKFAVLYVEYDGSICRGEGEDRLQAWKALSIVVAAREEKEHIAAWMKTAERGGLWIGWTKGRFAIVRTR